jgi:hypothetical protein
MNPHPDSLQTHIGRSTQVARPAMRQSLSSLSPETAQQQPPRARAPVVERIAGWSARHRPNTAPPYYLGHPADLWITIMRPRRRPAASLHLVEAAASGDNPTRDSGMLQHS